MTNAQKWMAAFLVMFLLLFFVYQLTENGNNSNKDENFYNINKFEQTSENENSAVLVKKFGCINCHGNNLRGTQKGPDLIIAKKYWTKNDLINYLRNPASYGKGERFVEYLKKYKVNMRSYNNVDVKTLGKIAAYIINLHE